jgi:hypothetical protein
VTPPCIWTFLSSLPKSESFGSLLIDAAGAARILLANKTVPC